MEKEIPGKREFKLMQKFISRKFILSILVLLLSVLIPVVYKHLEIGETVTLTVLGIMAGIGTGYGILNVRDSKNDLEKSNEAPK